VQAAAGDGLEQLLTWQQLAAAGYSISLWRRLALVAHAAAPSSSALRLILATAACDGSSRQWLLMAALDDSSEGRSGALIAIEGSGASVRLERAKAEGRLGGKERSRVEGRSGQP